MIWSSSGRHVLTVIVNTRQSLPSCTSESISKLDIDQEPSRWRSCILYGNLRIGIFLTNYLTCILLYNTKQVSLHVNLTIIPYTKTSSSTDNIVETLTETHTKNIYHENKEKVSQNKTDMYTCVIPYTKKSYRSYVVLLHHCPRLIGGGLGSHHILYEYACPKSGACNSVVVVCLCVTHFFFKFKTRVHTLKCLAFYTNYW